jgi:hypothetical protein
MKGYQNFFKRIEKKYIFTREKYNELMSRLEGKLDENEFPNSKILNLYFDTQNYDLAIKSIQKPIFKEKVRLRSYNVPNEDSVLFLELKRKYKGIVGKRRIGITKTEYEEYMRTGTIKNYEDKQIFKELDYTIKRYNIIPKMMVCYDREAYYLKENHNIRITFDFNLRSRTEDLDLFLGDAGRKFFEEDICILELKSCDAIPIWLAKLLNELKIYPTSFSKYGEIYKKMVLNSKEKSTYSISKNKKRKNKKEVEKKANIA